MEEEEEVELGNVIRCGLWIVRFIRCRVGFSLCMWGGDFGNVFFWVIFLVDKVYVVGNGVVVVGDLGYILISDVRFFFIGRVDKMDGGMNFFEYCFDFKVGDEVEIFFQDSGL